jgi:hypothetical protein
MNFRIPFVCVVGLVGAILAVPSHARGVIIDGSTCPTSLSSSDSESIDLPGTGNSGNSVKSGLNFPVLNCSPPKGLPTTNFSALAYDPTESLLYTWVDLAVADDTLRGVLAITESGLSTLNSPGGAPIVDSQAAIVAQVAVLKLTGKYKGGYEIIFSYQAGPLPVSTQSGLLPVSACNDVFKKISPSFTWYGTTYTFTYHDGAHPCDTGSTNDFVFGPEGKLLGYNATPTVIDPVMLIPNKLPPGWTK